MAAIKRKRDTKAEGPAATRTKTQPVSILKTGQAKAITEAKEKATIKAKATTTEAKSTPPPPPPPHASLVTITSEAPAAIQIVAGSYDRTLHGVVATVHEDSATHEAVVRFADTFLFNAHAAAIRCVALSPPSVPVPGQGQKVMLATGSTDERINVYNLSAHPPSVGTSAVSAEDRAVMAAVSSRPVLPIAESAKNRELGTLLNHASTVTRVSFPTRSKLLSASEDSTVGVTRTRDWSLLSAIKVPVPKEGTGGSMRRPSGDTAAPGQAPSGVNDFAVHPSMKVMISVSRGERCMRLWNLVTGKKAGVLNFGKDLLRDVGEGRHATGEGRRVVWGQNYDADARTPGSGSDEYAVAFDRNVVAFGMDSLPRCKVLRDSRTKTHDVHYFDVDSSEAVFSLLAVSTEDGRVLLTSTRADLLVADSETDALPCARLIGQLGGVLDVTDRVKAFKVLPVLESSATDVLCKAWYVVTASSAGALRVWKLTADELHDAFQHSQPMAATATATQPAGTTPRQIGTLVGTYLTRDRITCLDAFVMIPRPDGVDDSDIDIAEESSDEE